MQHEQSSFSDNLGIDKSDIFTLKQIFLFFAPIPLIIFLALLSGLLKYNLNYHSLFNFEGLFGFVIAGVALIPFFYALSRMPIRLTAKIGLGLLVAPIMIVAMAFCVLIVEGVVFDNWL